MSISTVLGSRHSACIEPPDGSHRTGYNLSGDAQAARCWGSRGSPDGSRHSACIEPPDGSRRTGYNLSGDAQAARCWDSRGSPDGSRHSACNEPPDGSRHSACIEPPDGSRHSACIGVGLLVYWEIGGGHFDSVFKHPPEGFWIEGWVGGALRPGLRKHL